MICKHDPKFIDTGDCIYCRCLTAEAIVNRLPRTADDVPIVPGMFVHTIINNQKMLCKVTGLKLYEGIWHVISYAWEFRADECRSN